MRKSLISKNIFKIQYFFEGFTVFLLWCRTGCALIYRSRSVFAHRYCSAKEPPGWQGRESNPGPIKWQAGLLTIELCLTPIDLQLICIDLRLSTIELRLTQPLSYTSPNHWATPHPQCATPHLFWAMSHPTITFGQIFSLLPMFKKTSRDLNSSSRKFLAIASQLWDFVWKFECQNSQIINDDLWSLIFLLVILLSSHRDGESNGWPCAKANGFGHMNFFKSSHQLESLLVSAHFYMRIIFSDVNGRFIFLST